ncbi:dihydroxyacetone kinase phosphoryl donor subunit DhaM [Paramicrobacterium agarici]|uniref:Phosphocarrier protein HPr n=1 Tax=Paramicrobacterium agarici TaxID=630514 RepID=A0A2A9DXW4_9MICO|nr:dihydroxyacetone kinase phosphoryl donor subunit DhaM [Microbacterium agarici]PFG31424.1 phosphocarrier protein HPr /dihydroxyacetone kinase DhaM subunit [Microbacterium agarici]TQO21312.1 phosphocarrier protein HPr /dihydroxyacetone kinase DhaM subunit [Microbacterium agarici]
MTVGIVIVSHSAKIAQGTVELAAQMAPSVVLRAAGGTDDDGIGTSFDKVTAAIGEADSGDGVVILCDLGSAVLTTETALEFVNDDQRARISLADAPVVEGAVAGAVAAETGGDVAAVISAAEHAGRGGLSGPGASEAGSANGPTGPVTRTVTLINRDGLHARPAADFVKKASGFDARISVNGVDAKSLLGIMSLGLVKGRDAELAADGPDASTAIEELAELIESGFGEK